MIEEKIKKIREKLNKSIEENANYDEIYKLSIELDELIAKYYEKNEEKKDDEENKKQ